MELQLQYICGMKSNVAIQQRLGKLPPTLQAIYKEVYDASMAGFEGHGKSISKAIFAWLISAYGAFDSTNFCLAIGWIVNDLDLTIEQILHYSFQMVAYDVEEDNFWFQHLSVREFLEDLEEYPASHTHSQIALACMVSLDNIDEAIPPFRNIGDIDPYAMVWWPMHVVEAEGYRQEGKLSTVLSQFLGKRGTDCSQAFKSWCSCENWQDWQDAVAHMDNLICDPPTQRL